MGEEHHHRTVCKKIEKKINFLIEEIMIFKKKDIQKTIINYMIYCIRHNEAMIQEMDTLSLSFSYVDDKNIFISFMIKYMDVHVS